MAQNENNPAGGPMSEAAQHPIWARMRRVQRPVRMLKVNPSGRMLYREARPTVVKCWLWAGAVDERGRGVTRENGQMELVRSVAWRVCYGEKPRGVWARERCAHPGCNRPAHLFLFDPDRDDEATFRVRRPELNQDNMPFDLGGPKLTVAQVQEARRRLAAGDKMAAIALDLGVGRTAIGAIFQGRTWAKLPMPDDVTVIPRRPVNNGKVLETEVPVIRDRVAAGEKASVLAVEYDVVPSTITDMVARRTWKRIA